MNKDSIKGNGDLRKSFKSFCIIGDPVSHSLSPLIHNSAFSSLNLNYSYIAFRVPQTELEESVYSLKKTDIAGFVYI